VGLYGFKVRHVFVEDSGTISATAEIKVAFDHIFYLLLQVN
jgi:hypothetical protein